VNRRKSNRRGELEMLRDLVKIAHFTCLIFSKYRKYEQIEERLIKMIKKGSV
jgi:hypothetical protein